VSHIASKSEPFTWISSTQSSSYVSFFPRTCNLPIGFHVIVRHLSALFCAVTRQVSTCSFVLTRQVANDYSFSRACVPVHPSPPPELWMMIHALGCRTWARLLLPATNMPLSSSPSTWAQSTASWRDRDIVVHSPDASSSWFLVTV
jgi:hypothetical protein